MFSEKFEKQMIDQYEKRLLVLGEYGNQIIMQMAKYQGDLEVAMKYLYGTMPISDIANYEPEVFLSYASHGVFLWGEAGCRNTIPEDIFAQYVLYHRINEEDISPCRAFFYDRIASRLNGLTMQEQALEVNYWCAEEATYQSTDDRTASPMTVFYSAYGRCGEESTFTVSALRSVGIPARQVYAPRWSHCDDNHAWVEVWCQGTWYFLGACEPEQILNKGWFTNASSRAMLIHSRYFGDPGKKELVTTQNQLKRYAKVKQVGIQVVNESNQPVFGARVWMEILNYSEFVPIASFVTDSEGMVNIMTGLGSIHVHVKLEEWIASQLLDTRTGDCFQVVLPRKGQAVQKPEIWTEMEVFAPHDSPINTEQPTKEQKQRGNLLFRQCVEKRQKKVEQWKPVVDQEIVEETEILYAARGNYPEIQRFLEKCKKDVSLAEWGKALLLSLSQKDYRDGRAEILWEHLEESLPYVNQYPKELVVPYLMCPRIDQEPLSAYKRWIKEQLTKDLIISFQKNPKKIWEMIQGEIKELQEEEYEALITLPKGCLSVKIASEQSQKILFVAVCRSIGIPARLHPVDNSMEYWEGCGFKSVLESDGKVGTLCITSEKEETVWIYSHNWTLGRLEDGVYKTLHLDGKAWETGGITLHVEPGEYRLLTSNRLPNGNVFVKEFLFYLCSEKEKKVALSLKEAKLSDMLEKIQVSDFYLKESDGTVVSAHQLMEGRQSLLLWLEESKEPTEHILNELYEHQEQFRQLDTQIYFVIRSPEALQDPTLCRTLQVLPEVRVVYDDFEENVQTLGRRMYVDPDKLPLILVIQDGLNGIYAASGYNVGTGNMLLRVCKGEA